MLNVSNVNPPYPIANSKNIIIMLNILDVGILVQMLKVIVIVKMAIIAIMIKNHVIFVSLVFKDVRYVQVKKN